MHFVRAFALLLSSFLMASPLNGQSLLKDTETLLSALEILAQRDSASSDSLLQDASAAVLAILYNYDNPAGPVSFTEARLNGLAEIYRENPLIRDLIEKDSISIFPEMADAFFVQRFQENLYALRAAPRHKMIDLLHAETAVSPASYLSISNTLRRYSIPPVKNTSSLRLAAEGSNRNVSRGIVEAPRLIEGLFEFVLNRAQQEVTVNFLERLLGEEVRGLEEIFPIVVSTFSGHDFTYSNTFIERLRQAFYEDLQLMSIRLPGLMLRADYFQALQDDPVSYNLLVVYSMAGMAQNGYALDEILPITNRYLYDSYGEAKKQVNLTLAVSAYDSPEYRDVIRTTENIVENLEQIYSSLDDAENHLRNSINTFKEDFPDLPHNPELDNYLNKKAYDFEVILGGGGNEYDLSMLPQLLRGELDSAYIMDYNTIEDYDKFFGEEHSPEQWRAAGLELARNLNGDWYAQTPIDQILRNWQKSLAENRLAAEQWINANDPQGALRRALARADSNRQQLQDTIRAALLYWQPVLSQNQRLALQLLESISSTSGFSDIANQPSIVMPREKKLEKTNERLVEIEQRLIGLNETLSQAYPEMRLGSPVLGYLQGREPTTPYTGIILMIDTLSDNLRTLKAQLADLDSKWAQEDIRGRDNAEPLLQLTEILTQLVYSLRSDDDDAPWMSREQLDTVFDGGIRQQAFLGLMTQRLLNIRDIGRFSPEGMAQLVELSVRDLPALADTDSAGQQDSLAFYRKASFAVNTFNRILELPLMVKPGSSIQEFQPITQQNPKLKGLPGVTGQAMDFIYYINVKDHRHAVSSAIRLFSSLDDVIGRMSSLPSDGLSKDKRRPAIRFFRDYGDFIAGLIDAREGDEVKALVSGIADPPGSARTKRREAMTVGINAYLGGAFGFESWDGDEMGTDNFLSMAPTMPLGISISGLFGKKRRSLSAFISFLDLGALLSYRGGTSFNAESVLTFRNIFKPGLQLHWNLRDTPFYLGLGGHYGPQFLETNGDQISVRSFRGFLAFGVDVPVRTLYQR